MTKCAALLARLQHAVSGMPAVDLALRLTLLDLLLRPIGGVWIRPLLLGLSGAGLLLPGRHRSSLLWLCLTVLTGLRVVIDWPLADNHAYLLCYWCLAVFLSLIDRHGPEACLASNARWLIGLVFALAVLWKGVLAPDYLDQTFFRVTLLVDERFEGLTRLAGGVSGELLEQSRHTLTQHVDAPAALHSSGLVLSPRFRALASFATFWTLTTELIVGLLFLWPLGRRGSPYRDAALLVFCATTYAVAPVEGFGWLLIAMGSAQSEPSPRLRWLYISVFLLILVYREVPWASGLADVLSAGGSIAIG